MQNIVYELGYLLLDVVVERLFWDMIVLEINKLMQVSTKISDKRSRTLF